MFFRQLCVQIKKNYSEFHEILANRSVAETVSWTDGRTDRPVLHFSIYFAAD